MWGSFSMLRHLFFVFFALGVMNLMSCGGDDPAPEIEFKIDLILKNSSGVETTVFTPGEIISCYIRLTNQTNRNVVVYSDFDDFFLKIYNTNGITTVADIGNLDDQTPIYTETRNGLITGRTTIPPGGVIESDKNPNTWDQIGNSGVQVANGIYCIRADCHPGQVKKLIHIGVVN